MTEKIAIVGAGNAGCISALNLHYLKETEGKEYINEIEIYHDPNTPIERVGQGTQINVRETIFDVLDLNWMDKNYIDATVKLGLRYQGWGQKNHDFFHPFDSGTVAMHYVPDLLSKHVLKSGLFNVVEKTITDPEEEIDATYIIDCRGKVDEIDDSYHTLTNPLNSVILARNEGADPTLLWTGHVATSNGWTFVIPNKDSVSYGYLYNNTITSKEDAEKDFIERFDVEPNGHLSFNNYLAKDMWRGERTLLNGNRLSFIEPMEATSSVVHHNVSELLFDLMTCSVSREEMNESIYREVMDVQDFILYHYKHGSKYDTPFWEYAKSLPLNNEQKLLDNFEMSNKLTNLYQVGEHMDDLGYGYWRPQSFRCWSDNVSG